MLQGKDKHSGRKEDKTQKKPKYHLTSLLPFSQNESSFAAFPRAWATHRAPADEVGGVAGVSMASPREVMNIKEASDYLGIAPDTLYRYVYNDRIPAFKLGNRWKFKKAILDRWIERKIVQGKNRRRRAKG